MKCPKCDKEMSPETYGQTEVDKCPECEGIYFDQGELDKLIKAGDDSADSLEYTELSNKMDMMLGTCHRCEQEMEPYLGPGNLRIDKCMKCNAVFLDQGEFAELVSD